MSSTKPWLTIIGIGEDGRDGLSARALSALERAEVVFGGKRHLALAQPLQAEQIAWPSPITDAYTGIAARAGQNVCVLATGDPFHYGVGAELAKIIPAAEMICFPQPSAFSLAASRLGWSLPDCSCISLHGRALERIIPYLQPHARLLALSWDETTPALLAKLLQERGFGTSLLTVLEAMGGDRERIQRAAAHTFSLNNIDPLNLVAIEVTASAGASVIPLSVGLDDNWFENDGQLTKAEIRAITLSALAPRVGDLLWDVGAGAGSISIEWMLRHPANRAIAVESRQDRAARIMRNAQQLGVPDLKAIIGDAPNVLSGLPSPDAIFIGGGAADPGVFDTCWNALRSGGRMVINGVTLETEHVLLNAYHQYGGVLRRIALSRVEPIGTMKGWKAAMPVTQWAALKP